MIEVRNLTKIYVRQKAVDDVSFSIEKGEVFGFLGPNGAGKSTTMRVLTCFIPATSGSATVAGHDVFRDSLRARRNIGYLPESVPLYPEMRAREYLRFRAAVKGVSRGARREQIGRAVERCGLGEVYNNIIGTLSKGYRQRLGLAAALLGDPPVMILDEPTIGLDPNQVREVRRVIKEMGADRTVILSTHILPEVEMMCGRVLIINRGRAVAIGTPAELAAAVEGKSKIDLDVRGSGERISEALGRIRGVTCVACDQHGETVSIAVEIEKGRDVREEISAALVASGGVIREMRSRKLSLEDIFAEMTGAGRVEL